jgi:acyl-coenzyme A synthetase/AMP-(fatty) acid ligase
MHQLFEAIGRHAAANTVAPAICGATRVLSYSDLVNAICNLCAAFSERGLRPGTKVFANIADPDMRFVVQLACLHYGVVPFLVFGPAQVPGQVDTELTIGANDPLTTDIPADLTVSDRIFASSAQDLASWGDRPRVDSDLILVAATSGTTGQWKLIGETCGHFTFQLDKSHDFGVGDRVMVILGELSLITLRTGLRALVSGATVVRANNDPLTCLRLINLFAVNKFILSPKALERLMDIMDEMSIRCPSLKTISVTGSLFTLPILERAEALFDAQIIVLYGSMEAGGIASGPVKSATFTPGYVGRIRDYMDVRIDSGADGEPGQVVLRNDPVLVQRYYENGAIVPNEAEEYRMPDLGVIRDGHLFLTGRDDEVYNYSGHKIAFSTMVDHLAAEDGVADVAIVHPAGNPDPFALNIAIVARVELDMARLGTLLGEKLSLPAITRHLDIRAVSHIPRNASDKVDRRALLGMFAGS